MTVRVARSAGVLLLGFLRPLASILDELLGLKDFGDLLRRDDDCDPCVQPGWMGRQRDGTVRAS